MFLKTLNVSHTRGLDVEQETLMSIVKKYYCLLHKQRLDEKLKRGKKKKNMSHSQQVSQTGKINQRKRQGIHDRDPLYIVLVRGFLESDRESKYFTFL